MADGQQEHRREHPVANRQRCGHSQIFSDHKRRARHRLADDCQHRFVVDLVCKHAGSGESSQQQAGEEQRAQTQVDQQFVVVFQRERREVHVEHQRQDAHHHQHDEHRLADRFEKPIAGDGEDDHCGGYSGCPGPGRRPVIPTVPYGKRSKIGWCAANAHAVLISGGLQRSDPRLHWKGSSPESESARGGDISGKGFLT